MLKYISATIDIASHVDPSNSGRTVIPNYVAPINDVRLRIQFARQGDARQGKSQEKFAQGLVSDSTPKLVATGP